nr:hypothetical protein [uncultured Flavobacterium sp.]
MLKIIIPIKFKNNRFLFENSTPENDEYIKNFYKIVKEIHRTKEMIISISELESQFLKLLKNPKVLLTSLEYEKFNFQFINVDNIPMYHSLETISKGIK